MRMIARSFAIVFLLSAVQTLAQDLTIVAKVTRDEGAPTTSTSYMSEDHARMALGDGNEIIIDLKSGQMTTIDNRKRTYSVTTRQDMDALAARLQEQMNSPEMKKAQEQMKNLPPEQRQRMEDMMGSMFKFDVQKSGNTRRIAGYTCEEWTVTMGQISRTEECLTNDVKLPLKTWDTYRSFSDSMKSLMASMGPMVKNMATMQEQFKKMKGLPLAHKTIVDVMGRKSVTSSEVTEIKHGPIPATAWDIPAGYTKVDSPMLKAMQQHR